MDCLYNWQQRNEQKKIAKKKIAKAETPSFTPTKYAKAKISDQFINQLKVMRYAKHRERLNRAREKEKEKHQLHVPGKKWTRKSTMPKSPTLSYQTRMKKKGKSQNNNNNNRGISNSNNYSVDRK